MLLIIDHVDLEALHRFQKSPIQAVLPHLPPKLSCRQVSQQDASYHFLTRSSHLEYKLLLPLAKPRKTQDTTEINRVYVVSAQNATERPAPHARCRERRSKKTKAAERAGVQSRCLGITEPFDQ
jgi:hypothetical protein